MCFCGISGRENENGHARLYLLDKIYFVFSLRKVNIDRPHCFGILEAHKKNLSCHGGSYKVINENILFAGKSCNGGPFGCATLLQPTDKSFGRNASKND